MGDLPTAEGIEMAAFKARVGIRVLLVSEIAKKYS
jgi:hypothetical protein